MLTLTRQKRAANEEHGKFPSRRSVQELRNIEGFLKAKHDTLTDALRNFNEVLFSPHRLHHHQQQQHPIQGGIPPQAGLSSILMPFSFQPARNTVLFLHHNSHRSGNNSNISGTNGENIFCNNRGGLNSILCFDTVPVIKKGTIMWLSLVQTRLKLFKN